MLKEWNGAASRPLRLYITCHHAMSTICFRLMTLPKTPVQHRLLLSKRTIIEHGLATIIYQIAAKHIGKLSHLQSNRLINCQPSKLPLREAHMLYTNKYSFLYIMIVVLHCYIAFYILYCYILYISISFTYLLADVKPLDQIPRFRWW